MRTEFTSENLKWIAMGTMAVDHAACLVEKSGLFPGGSGVLLESAMRLVGRMAFPLFAFMVVEGFLYTRDWRRYGVRLAVLAVLSEIPFNLVAGGSLFYPAEQNTVFTLLFGLLAVKACDWALRGSEPGTGNRAAERGRGAGQPMPPMVWIVLAAILFSAAAQLLRTDYGAAGVILILVLYFYRGNPPMRLGGGCMILLCMYMDLYALAAAIAFYFINRYNGERGRRLGYGPYVFYPGHLLVIYGLGVILHGFNI